MEVSWDTQPVLPGATGHIHVVHKADRKGNFQNDRCISPSGFSEDLLVL